MNELTKAIEATRRLVELQEKATPGWEVGRHGDTVFCDAGFFNGKTVRVAVSDAGPNGCWHPVDAKFAVDARNYPASEVLRLLERLERREKLKAAVQQQLEERQ